MHYDDMSFFDAYIDKTERGHSSDFPNCSEMVTEQTSYEESVQSPQVRDDNDIPGRSQPPKSKIYKMKLSEIDKALVKEIRNYPVLYASTTDSKTKLKRTEAFKKIANTILDKDYVARTPEACIIHFLIIHS